MESRAARRQIASAVILSTACIALALSSPENANGSTTASLSPTSIAFGSEAVGATSAARTVTLSNTGKAALSITSLGIKGSSSSNFAETNTCGKSLAAGAKCTISGTFTPSATGSRTATLTILDNASGSPQTVSLTGTGVRAAPVASLSPSSLAFGSQSVGAASTVQSVTLSNTGNAALSITSLALTGTNAASFAQANTCGRSLAAGANCTVSVTFRPSATGSSTASLSITDNASGSPHKVSLSGTGNNPAPTLASLSPASAVTGGGARTVNLTGTNFLASSTVTYNAVGHAATFLNSTQLTISLSATDQATGGNYSVAVTNPAPGGGASSPLSFTVASPIVSFSPASLAFGNQPADVASTAQTVTLSNTGNAPLSITSLTLAGANAADFTQNDTCPSSLAAGANCTIVVMFTPSFAGTEGASLSISDNSTGSPHAVPLSGTGTHDVILSWASVSTPGIVGYDVYRGITSGGEGATPLNSSPITGTTYTDTTVEAGQTYYYVVKAVASDDSTQSANSNEVSATVPSP